MILSQEIYKYPSVGEHLTFYQSHSLLLLFSALYRSHGFTTMDCPMFTTESPTNFNFIVRQTYGT